MVVTIIAFNCKDKDTTTNEQKDENEWLKVKKMFQGNWIPASAIHLEIFVQGVFKVLPTEG